ncbi:hemicentin-1-like [Watersipora subatra]|uniref:hemicentin-1-like n=1 Tax=Watersipora subatra TaxID=2589382 RepID=UPI00355B6544
MQFGWLCLLLAIAQTAGNDVMNPEATQGAASLAFVFDVTGSMYDDLLQVIEGASRILATTLSRREQPLHNYVLVPFRDPEIGPITVTTDADEFEDQLSYLYVQGGGDCPEVSIGAIQRALEVSLPRSYIYVFTDARAKDYHLTDRVIELIQRKESQVVFVMTGDCGDNTHEGFLSYLKIASTSSGQVFLLKKHQVDEVIGTDENGFTFIRISKSAISAVVPAAPVITIAPQIIGNYGSSINMLCIVESLVPFVVTWYKGDKSISDDRFFLQTESVIHTVENLTEVSEGNYSCVATSDAGRGQGVLVLDVTDPPPYIYPTLNVTVAPGARAILDCVVESDIEYDIRWYRMSPHSGRYITLPALMFLPNGSLSIPRVEDSSEGWYICEAENIGGATSQRTFLKVGEPPVARVRPRDIDFVAGGEMRLRCTATGSQPVRISWRRRGQTTLFNGGRVELKENELLLRDMQRSDAGVYECVATNLAGVSTAAAAVRYMEKPYIMLQQDYLLVAKGDSAALVCQATGIPAPEIIWFKNGKEINERNAFVRVTSSGELMLLGAQPEDAADYTCLAQNAAGTDQAVITLEVGSIPVINDPPRSAQVDIGSDFVLPCSAIGYPPPSISWTKDGQQIDGRKMTIHSNNSLSIYSIGKDDEGTYICSATNQFGSHDATASIVVTGIVSPVIAFMSPLVELKQGETFFLKCMVIVGNPEPTIEWFKNGEAVSSVPGKTIISREGTLTVTDVRVADEGEYMCRASNIGGTAMMHTVLDVRGNPISLTDQHYFINENNGLEIFVTNTDDTAEYACTARNPVGDDTKTYLLTIRVPPEITDFGPTEYTVISGDPVTLQCQAAGTPMPTVQWRKNGNFLTSEDFASGLTIMADGSLRLSSARTGDEGLYSCVATNDAGKATKSIKLVVQDGIELTGNELSLSLNSDGSLDISIAQVSDSGRYTCKAVNEAGDLSLDIDFFVYVPPVIPEDPLLWPVDGEVTTVVTSTLTLQCPAEAIPPPVITWYLDGNELEVEPERMLLQQDGRVLVIKQLDLSDAGRYRCVAKNVAGETERATNVNIHDPDLYPISENGSLLTIPLADVADSGRYVCIAENEAGKKEKTFDVTLLIPPSIDVSSSTTNVSVVQNDTAVLICAADGSPYPEVLWLFNNELIDASSRPQTEISARGRQLRLHNVQLSDEAVYTCLATNKAGDDRLNVTLNVLIPPSISTDGLQPNSSVVKGLRTAIECPVKGKPEPNITWYKDGVELGIASNPYVGLVNARRRLIIANASLSDTAIYTCRASNVAGRSELRHQLTVYDPPSIEDSDVVTPLEVLINSSITINCIADGIPRPSIEWLKNGQTLSGDSRQWRLSRGGYSLTLLKADLSHTARYTCIASNEAGSEDKDFDLDVLVPPYIDETSIEKDIRIIKGRQLTLNCPAMGTPYPDVRWYRNGFLVNAESALSLLSSNRQLSIYSIGVDDTGSYTCQARNIAGQASLRFSVFVLVPPTIDDSNLVTRPRVRQNNTVIIECPAHGIPNPNVTFLKNGRPIEEESHIVHEKDGKRFLIDSAQVTDTGRYTCIAMNEAGEARRTYDLQIQVPARIETVGLAVDLSVIENRTALISCPVTGIPQPSIIWFRGRVPLIDGPYPNIRLLNQDQQLELSKVQLSDAGSYSCKATNAAGRDRQEFNLQVYLPPEFEEEAVVVPEEFISIVRKSFSLSCPVEGEPKPVVNWYKDGILISRENLQYRVSFDGELLDIISVRVEDAGKFTCEAVNPAGKIDRDFTLTVHVPTTITGANEITDISVIVGQPTTLRCPVTGSPTPRISWFKDGEILDPRASSNIRVVDNGQQLIVVDAQLLDVGSYLCIASNAAGNDSKPFRIDVQVPPSIDASDAFVVATDKTRTLLLCETYGLPTPNIRWYKDGFELNTIANSRYRMLQSGSLEFSMVKPSDTGNYTCVATNEAGISNKTLTLSIQVLPQHINPYQEVSVNSGGDITLTCDVIGTPTPRVIWQIGTRIVANYPPEQNNKSLLIEGARSSDSGSYICIAQNPAGTSTGRVKLQVLVKPTIDTNRESYRVIEGRELQLPCPSQGVPKPEIRWSKDGEEIASDDFRFRVLQGGRLSIAISRSEDEGVYTCEAFNEAGVAYHNVKVNVLVPAKIVSYERLVTAVQNSVVDLVCEVEGVPFPSISWMRNRIQIDSDSKYSMRNDGTLVINGVKSSDSSTYTCEAVNEAGQDSAEIALRIQVPPKIIEAPVPVEVSEGDRIYMQCEADGIPVPSLVWKLNGTLIASPTSVAGRSSLVVEDARVSDTGTYMCLAENAAGVVWKIATAKVNIPPRLVVAPGNTAVRISNQVLLECSVQGTPPPQVIWTKDGSPVLQSNRIQQLENGSLVIKNTVSGDGGLYKCVASNDAGTSEGSAQLIIRSPPVFTSEPPAEVIVRQGYTRVIDCAAYGDPIPTVSWKRDNIETLAGNSSERISQLQNNSLQIIVAQPEDTGIYICLVNNSMGSVLKKVSILIQVDGGWEEWTSWSGCSVTCGYGLQTRSRTCTSPAPANGGQECVGSAEVNKACLPMDCAVNGRWSDWLPWETCSATCGKAERVRRRYCDNPAPKHGGAPCPEEPMVVEACDVPACPVDGNWTRWSPWQPCSLTCGDGYQERYRFCSEPSPSNGGLPCYGADTDRRQCNNAECPVHGFWSSWGSWDTCTVSCGGGQRLRKRLCGNPAPANGGRQCIGFAEQLDYCNPELCPIHGNWSGWQQWGECTLPCNGGQRKRFRACDNPAPQLGGRSCIGARQETGACNSQSCPEGVWTNWESWSECSVSCGEGVRRRERSCLQPVSGSQQCDGKSEETDRCSAADCRSPTPTVGRGNVLGEINGIVIEPMALLDVLITPALSGDEATIIMGDIAQLPPVLGSPMRLLSSLISSFYWTTAFEMGGAHNGYTLTDGNFHRESQVEFTTGEVVKLNHVARGLDSNGIFQVDIMVSGSIPEFPLGSAVTLEPYIEDYIQTGPGKIYGSSSRLFRVDGRLLPYAWNHTIFYDETKYDKMPFLVQRLNVLQPSAGYSSQSQSLSFDMRAYVEPGDNPNQCPNGFIFQESGPYCQDTDECSRLSPCSHQCANTAGGYRCSCPTGLTLMSDAKTCQDIDECAIGLARCHRSQECINTQGSYKCLAKCSDGYTRTEDGLSCIDIDECKASSDSICDQKCVNLQGSYQCKCRFGFRLYGRSRCIDINECQRLSPPCSHTCQNTAGGYKCLCPDGMRLVGGMCENVNECEEGLDTCRADEQCKDLPAESGKFECLMKCPAGLDQTADGKCVDQDECARGTHKCTYNQICNNLNGTYTCSCRKGYRTDGPGRPCVDLNECARPGLCQYQCRNLDGSFQCVCPMGFSLTSTGRSCIDRDECRELNIHCGLDQKCFNQRGTYQCIDVQCPTDYVRLNSGGCGLPCSERPELPCLSGMFVDVIEFHTLAIPSGVPARQDLLRLTAYNQNHDQLLNTDFIIAENDLDSFGIRVEFGRGIVSPILPLQADTTYRLKVQSTSLDDKQAVQYQTTFIIYISVSQYPF